MCLNARETPISLYTNGISVGAQVFSRFPPLNPAVSRTRRIAVAVVGGQQSAVGGSGGSIIYKIRRDYSREGQRRRITKHLH